MKELSIVLVFVLGTVAGLVLHQYIFPSPELPEQQLIAGDTTIVYRDTTIYVDRPVYVPIVQVPEDTTEYSTFEQDVSLFDGVVEFTLSGRAIDLHDLKITNARLHVQEKTITVTDTLRLPYAVEVGVSRQWYDSFKVGAIAGISFMILTTYLVIQIFKII